MNVQYIVESIKRFVSMLNSKGIPLPMLRDPKTGTASMTATLVFLSFNTALLGQIGRITHLLGSVDLTQANYLFLCSLGAYLGRRLQSNGATKSVDISKDGT
jgi:hypothetical protein